jgi:hypothetical protein
MSYSYDYSPTPSPSHLPTTSDDDDDEIFEYDGEAWGMLIPLAIIAPVGLLLLFLNFRRLEKYAAGKTDTGVAIEMNQMHDLTKLKTNQENSTKEPLLPSVLFIPKHFFKCWVLYALVCVLFTWLGDVMLSGADGQTMTESVFTRWLADLFLTFAGAEVAHCYMMLLFMLQKQHYTVHDLVHVEEDSKFDEEGATVIFARKLDCVGCLLTSTVGLMIEIVQYFFIDTATMFGLDLSMFFFPAPFYQFWKAKLLIRSIRVKGAQLKFSAVQADAYFLFLWVKLYNFFSCGLYSKYCAKNMYEKWLDSKLTWKDSAPDGFTNDNFQIFLDKLSFCEKLQSMLLVFLFGLIPGFQPVLMYWAYTKRLPHLKIGSVHPNFDSDFTVSGFFCVWLSTICGLCGTRKLKRYADTNIRFDMRQDRA